MTRRTRLNTIATARDVTTLGARSLAMKTKVLGGNITVKPGYGWRHLWSEWDWDNWIRPQVDRALMLGLNAIRLIGGPHVVTSATISWPAWTPSSTHFVDKIITNGGRAYRCTAQTGPSASSGGGPTGTGSSITDGSVTWAYVRQDDLAPLTQAQYDAHWAQLATYCTSKGMLLYPCLCQIEDPNSIGSGEFQNTAMTASITTTAAALAAFPNVIGFEVFQEGDTSTGTAWKASRSYSTGVYVNNGGKSYKATTGGTSASSGGGPSGTGSSITDGSVTWAYQGIPLMKADVLALLDKLRAVCNLPLAMSFNASFFSYAWSDAENLWYQCLVDPAGPDIIDIHVYDMYQTGPESIDFLVSQTGKPVLIGEYGVNQSQSSDVQAGQMATAAAIHKRSGVLGSFVWAMADQSLTDAGKAGVWDNTGFVQGSAPLSTTSGRRPSLTAAVARMTAATPPRPYEQPNIAPPAVSRPPRGAAHPGGYATFWSAEANTTIVADDRGLGVKCVAGGTQTGIYVTNIGDKPIWVTGNVWYRIKFDVLAATTGREFLYFIDWYDEAGTLLSRSPGTGLYFADTDSPYGFVAVSRPVRSNASATRARPTIRWSAAQATDELHIMSNFDFIRA